MRCRKIHEGPCWIASIKRAAAWHVQFVIIISYSPCFSSCMKHLRFPLFSAFKSIIAESGIPQTKAPWPIPGHHVHLATLHAGSHENLRSTSVNNTSSTWIHPCKQQAFEEQKQSDTWMGPMCKPPSCSSTITDVLILIPLLLFPFLSLLHHYHHHPKLFLPKKNHQKSGNPKKAFHETSIKPSISGPSRITVKTLGLPTSYCLNTTPWASNILASGCKPSFVCLKKNAKGPAAI